MSYTNGGGAPFIIIQRWYTCMSWDNEHSISNTVFLDSPHPTLIISSLTRSRSEATAVRIVESTGRHYDHVRVQQLSIRSVWINGPRFSGEWIRHLTAIVAVRKVRTLLLRKVGILRVQVRFHHELLSCGIGKF